MPSRNRKKKKVTFPYGRSFFLSMFVGLPMLILSMWLIGEGMKEQEFFNFIVAMGLSILAWFFFTFVFDFFKRRSGKSGVTPGYISTTFAHVEYDYWTSRAVAVGAFLYFVGRFLLEWPADQMAMFYLGAFSLLYVIDVLIKLNLFRRLERENVNFIKLFASQSEFSAFCGLCGTSKAYRKALSFREGQQRSRRKKRRSNQNQGKNQSNGGQTAKKAKQSQDAPKPLQDEQQGDLSPEIFFPAKAARFTYQDVMGMGKLKSELDEAYSRFKREGGNGILLYGPPGNGKTFIAEAFAGQHNLAFMAVSIGELKSKWVNETPILIRQMFLDALKQAPVLLFLDEAEQVLTNRSNSPLNTSNEDMKATNQFLTELAELNRGTGQHKVFIMGATNYLDQVDSAATREGRFDVKIEVPPPDEKARIGLVKKMLGECGARYDDEELRLTVSRWAGFSVSRVIATAKAMCRNYRKNQKTIGYNEALQALKQSRGKFGVSTKDALPLQDLALKQSDQREILDLIAELKKPIENAKYGVNNTKGLIMTGPAGIGKTTISKTIAKELDWAFLITTGADLADPNKIDEVYDKINDIRPVVVLIDEADPLIKARSLGNVNGEALTKFLSMVDGPRELKDVLFVATTNMDLEEIDSAVKRGGRLDRHLDLTPDVEAMVKLLKMLEKRFDDAQVDGDLYEIARRLIANGKYQADVINLFGQEYMKSRRARASENDPVIVRLEV